VISTSGDEIDEREPRALLPIAGCVSSALDYVEGKTLRELLDDAERRPIRRALDHHMGNVIANGVHLPDKRDMRCSF
jgi:hypothetical protein